MTRLTSLLPAMVVALVALVPADGWAQRHRPHPVQQAVDPEAPPEATDRPVVAGLRSYRPNLAGTLIGDETAALRRSARNHRIAGISLTVAGALSVAGAVSLLASAGGDDRCSDNDLAMCGVGAIDGALTGTAALGLGLVGGVLTVVGLAIWGSSAGTEERADRLEAVAAQLPWVAPTEGGAVAGVRLSLD